MKDYQYIWYRKNVLDKWVIERINGTLVDLGKWEDKYKDRMKQCICGLFYDGEFYPITNMNVFYYMLNLLKNEDILEKLGKLKNK